MRRTIRRLAVGASCAAALSVLSLTPAQAVGPAVVTGSATNIAGVLAVVTGDIYPAGQPTYYEFLYGPTTSFGQHTAVQSIGAGVTSLQVVTEVITGLIPGATYHFELVAAPASGGYYATPGAGGDRMFTTHAGNGSLRLASTNLIVKHGKVKMSWTCASSRACKGAVKITHGSARCVRKQFSIKAGAHKVLTARVSGACRTLLSNAKHHRTHGKLVATTSTSQPKLSAGVTLIRR